MVCHWFNLLLSDSSDTDVPAGPANLPESRLCPVRYSTRSGLHAHASTLSYSDWGPGRWIVPPRGPLSSQLMLVETQGQTRADRQAYKCGRLNVYSSPSPKLQLVLPITAKGYSILAGTCASGSGLRNVCFSPPRCHFLSGPLPDPPRCHRRSQLAWPGTPGLAAAGPPSVDPGLSPSGPV